MKGGIEPLLPSAVLIGGFPKAGNRKSVTAPAGAGIR